MDNQPSQHTLPVHIQDHNQQPTTKYSISQYGRVYWSDYVTLAIMGALGLGIYMLRPLPNRLFPLTFQDGEVVYPQFAYPLVTNIVPIWLAALFAFGIPFIVFCLFQIRIRNFHDFNSATLGLLYSLVTAAIFQVVLKWMIGGLRPHFYSVCAPRADGLNVGKGYQQLMVDRSVCTGDDKLINDALESFPSGHSTAAFAGFIYLSLYINAKLKIFSNYHPHYYKFVLFYTPILMATLIAGSLTIDEFHHWYDVVSGAVIGTMMAFGAWRFVWASVWGPNNHVPLVRDPRFEVGDGGVVTRRWKGLE